jgi:hypothetical protein
MRLNYKNSIRTPANIVHKKTTAAFAAAARVINHVLFLAFILF